MTDPVPSKDIVARLRDVAGKGDIYDLHGALELAAADEIERLQRQVDELSAHAEKWVKRTLELQCRTAPEPEPTHYAFLIKRPRDSKAWATIFIDRERAIAYPDRASPVVPVCVAQPPRCEL